MLVWDHPYRRQRFFACDQMRRDSTKTVIRKKIAGGLRCRMQALGRGSRRTVPSEPGIGDSVEGWPAH